MQPRTPILKGQVHPVNPRRSRPPEWDDKTFCGKRGQVYTVARVWLYGATPEFPTVGINLSLSNGAGSAFTQLTPSELETLVAFLQNAQRQIASHLPKLQAEAELINAQRRKMDEAIQQAREMQNRALAFGQPPFSDGSQSYEAPIDDIESYVRGTY